MQCLSLFAFLPAPFVYGALFDSSCVLWDVAPSCDGAGAEEEEERNCLVYDTDSLRRLVNGFTAALMLLAALCDFAVGILAKDLELYDQSEQVREIK